MAFLAPLLKAEAAKMEIHNVTIRPLDAVKKDDSPVGTGLIGTTLQIYPFTNL